MRPDYGQKSLTLHTRSLKSTLLKGWIIYPRYISLHKDNAFEWMKHEASQQGISLDVLFAEDFATVCGTDGNSLLHMGKQVGEYPGFVIMRGHETALSRFFEMKGVPVVNSSESSLLAKDKLLAGQVFAQAGIPIPLTVGCPQDELWGYGRARNAIGANRFIVKRRDGSKGEDVYLVENAEQMEEAVGNCGTNCIIQEFIGESSGRDLRVWVTGGKAAACVMRYSDTSFKANFSQGGKVAAYEMTDEVKHLAEKAANVLGLEFAGVDLLFGRDGLLVCEANGNAGFRTLSSVGDNRIPAGLFTYIAGKYGKLP